jgi:hypothetical protein
MTIQKWPNVERGALAPSTREAERKSFIQGMVADFAALRRDPKVWVEELAEVEAWDATSSDGLEGE